MLGGMLRILVIGLLVLVVALMLTGREARLSPGPDAATVLPESRALPPVSFIDQHGDAVATADLAGNFTLLFFGFTNCPDICPITLQTIALATQSIAERQPRAVPRVAFVSVDPARDDPERIGAYLRSFDPDFVGLTTDEAALAPLLADLGVTVHKTVLDGEQYNVVHNGTIYVLDPDANWIALFSGQQHDAATIATDVLRIRRLHAGGNLFQDPDRLRARSAAE